MVQLQQSRPVSITVWDWVWARLGLGLEGENLDRARLGLAVWFTSRQHTHGLVSPLTAWRKQVRLGTFQLIE